MKRLVVAGIAALVATGAVADPLTDLIGSEVYWRAMVWEKAEQSRIWEMNGWIPFEGKQEKGQTFAKERPVEIDGKRLRAYLIVEDTPQRHNVLSINSINSSADECEQIRSWLATKFGQPRIMVDGGYKYDLVAQGNWGEFIDKWSQWEIGSTRTTFRCGGLKTAAREQLGQGKATGIVVLTFGSKTSEREVRPLFGLRCTQRMEFIGIALAPRNVDDVVFVIDENQQRVRSANRVPILGEHQISEDAIEFKTKKDDLAAEYFIDRHTGAFRGKLRYLTKAGGAEVSGRCEKIDPGERKF